NNKYDYVYFFGTNKNIKIRVSQNVISFFDFKYWPAALRLLHSDSMQTLHAWRGMQVMHQVL
uniref:Uncharacterized protein n=1 Tax=Oryzias melastigma TaxID=30732 RepID=A0A3B3CSP3_ORYME